jgi:hypothetical protein
MYLLEDYTQASQLLLMSVEELKQSTEAARLPSPRLPPWRLADRRGAAQMTTHIKRIERVESELAQVVKTAAGKKDVESLRAEYRKLIVSHDLTPPSGTCTDGLLTGRTARTSIISTSRPTSGESVSPSSPSSTWPHWHVGR